MRGKVSLPGLLLGALAALAVGLLVSHSSFAWLVIGLTVGIVMGAALARGSRDDAGLRKGEPKFLGGANVIDGKSINFDSR